MSMSSEVRLRITLGVQSEIGDETKSESAGYMVCKGFNTQRRQCVVYLYIQMIIFLNEFLGCRIGVRRQSFIPAGIWRTSVGMADVALLIREMD